MNGPKEYLPIKVVVPSEQDLKPPRGGRGRAKSFMEYYEESRGRLLRDLDAVEEYFQRVLTKTKAPAVARMLIRDEAIAKSHFPVALLDRTCRVIGSGDFGQIHISLRPADITALRRRIQDNGKTVRNDIAKIEGIRPYLPQDALGQWTNESLAQQVKVEGRGRLKVRLFNHQDEYLNELVLAALREVCEAPGWATVETLRYAPGLRVVRVRMDGTEEQIRAIARCVATQSVGLFETFEVSTQSSPRRKIKPDDLPPPVDGEQYPLVGLIDTGTDPGNEDLQRWVQTRDEHVPVADQDNTHGTLVGSLLVNSRGLNHGHDGFPSGGARIVDVVAIPGSGTTTEDDLIESVRRACESHGGVKVWNLSVNSVRSKCRDDRFSEFAMAMDAIQDEFGVLIVNSAGNVDQTPLHAWRRPDLKGADRIVAPADTLRGITVGSIAHLSRHGACAAVGEPSPFTRKGPGAAYVPKPDVCHFGGNATSALDYAQMGVLSVDGRGNVAETIGTSFATPLVSLTAAQLHMAVSGASRHLVKALIIHSAVLRNGDLHVEDLPFRGFGKPADISDILQCNASEATLVFDLALPYHKRHFHKADFPVPPCLHADGKVFGEIVLTLVYDPPVNPHDGASYSQVNVNVSLGICKMDGSDVGDYKRQVLPFPENVKDLFEKNQIEHGFKWSPVKVYRRKFEKLSAGDMWRLTIEMSSRTPWHHPLQQPISLIATIRDPEGKRPVYNEVVQMMNRAGWITQNLQVRDVIRVRAQGA
jgi:hypothetical protein